MLKLLSTTVLAIGLIGSSAFAQTDNVANQAGLVNVAVGNVASGNEVIAQVPIGIAAQACGISAAVLADLEAGETACELTQEQATAAGIDGGPGNGNGNGQGQGGNKANQAGLVNVAVGNVASDNQVIVQVPIQLAAQVCGVTVGVLAQAKGDDAACTLTQEQATEAGIGG